MPRSMYIKEKGITVCFPDDWAEDRIKEVVGDIVSGKVEIPEEPLFDEPVNKEIIWS